MAANASTSTGTTASFSVGWLKAIEFSDYITAFTIHGHVNYESCINLSEKVLRAVGVKNDNHVRLLMNRVKDLRKLSEEDAVKLLSVSTCYYSVLCEIAIMTKLDHGQYNTRRWIGNGINIRRVTKNNPRNGYNGVIYGIPYILLS